MFTRKEPWIFAGKYSNLIDYLNSHYEPKVHSVEVCLSNYKRYHPYKPIVSAQQVYNWINQGKLIITPDKM